MAVHGRPAVTAAAGAAREGAGSETAAPQPAMLAAGNEAVQRLVRAGAAQEHQAEARARAAQELEAEARARAARSAAGGAAAPASCGCGGGSGCGCGRARAAPPRVGRGLRELAGGQRLPNSVRARLGQQLGSNFDDVRVHTGEQAGRLTGLLNARAVTRGTDIAFKPGDYRPGTAAGDELLGHELTHVQQQRADGRPRLQRAVEGDVRQMSISPQWAAALTDPELAEQVGLLRRHLHEIGPAAQDYESLRGNLEVLEEAVRERARAGRAVEGATIGGVERPSWLPAGGGFLVEPIDLPAGVAGDLPEGEVTELPWEALGGAGTGLLLVTAQQLQTHGFASASEIAAFSRGAQGADAIGVVSFPRWRPDRMLQGLDPGSTRPLIPQSRMAWGHTAVYARIDGRIQIIRSFGPDNLVEAFQTNRSTGGQVMAGSRTVPGAWYHGGTSLRHGIPMLTNTMASTVEYPVTRPMAQAFAQSLPDVGPSLTRYTGGPDLLRGQNCISCAVQLVEDTLGGKVGRLEGRGGLPQSVIDTDFRGERVPRAASQGRMYSWLTELESGQARAAPVPEATGEPVARSMPRGMQILRWGNRVFMVVGVASIPLEYHLAEESEKTRTLVGATAGFGGGLAAGAVAGLACGPGAPVCSIVLGIGGGILGGLASRKAAESIYDAAAGRTQPARPYTGYGSADCPTCHTMQRDWARERSQPFGGTDLSGVTAPDESLLWDHFAPSGHQRSLSDADFELVMEYINSLEPETREQP